MDPVMSSNANDQDAKLVQVVREAYSTIAKTVHNEACKYQIMPLSDWRAYMLTNVQIQCELPMRLAIRPTTSRLLLQSLIWALRVAIQSRMHRLKKLAYHHNLERPSHRY